MTKDRRCPLCQRPLPAGDTPVDCDCVWMATLPVRLTVRADGWPLCPTCGDDELYSLAVPARARTIHGCYACGPWPAPGQPPYPPPAPGDRAPDVVGEITGWRTWAVLGLMRPTLLSLSTGTEWPHGAYLYATCDSCLDIPGEHCREDSRPGHGCGIHATRDQQRLRATGYNRREVVDQLWSEHRDASIAIGEVALSGRVIVGGKGWRAARARPVRLWVPFDRWRLVDQLSRAYGVPVHLANLQGEIAP